MKKVQTLDYVVNFFWTGIGFLPLVIYWRQTPLTIIFYGFLLISVIFANISQKIHHLFRLSSKTKTYEFLGVKLVRKFIQDGDYIRKGNPGIKSKAEAKKYLLRILMYERFHTLCLLVFYIQYDPFPNQQQGMGWLVHPPFECAIQCLSTVASAI